MEFLPLGLLRQRMNAIRTVRLLWELPDEPFLLYPEYSAHGLEIYRKRLQRWGRVWEIISTMTGLHELHVKLKFSSESPRWATLNKEAAAVLLEPIKQVTKPDVFILSLPFPAMHEGMSFVIRRWRGAATNEWEGSDPWDDLPNCTIRRVQDHQEL